MILGVIIGSILYKKIQRFKYEQWSHTCRKNNTKLVLTILRILFFGIMSISIYIIFTYSSYIPPLKPIQYYILTTMASVILIISISIKVRLGLKKYYFELFQAFLLATMTYFTTQLIVYPYSGIGSIDTIHNIFRISGDISIVRLMSEGRIPNGVRYSYFPGHYLLVYEIATITNINPELMYYYLGGFIGTSTILLNYIIGKKVTENTIFPIVVALITSMGLDYYNYWISHPHQFTYAFPLAVFSFAVLLIYTLTSDPRYISIMIVSYTVLSISHDYTTVLFTLGIITVYIVTNLFRTIYSKKLRLRSSIIFLMICIMVVRLTYHHLDLTMLISSFNEYLEDILSLKLSSPDVYSKTSWEFIFTNTLSSAILLMLATIGAIYTLERIANVQKKASSAESQIIESDLSIFFIFGVYYLILIVIGIILKSHYLLPQRIYVLFQIFSLVYLSGYTVSLLLKSTKKVLTIVVILLTFLFFFSQTTTIAGFESSPSLFHTPFVKTYYTPQEIASGVWVSSNLKPNSVIYTSLTLNPQALLIKINAKEFLQSVYLKRIVVVLSKNNSCRYNVQAYNEKNVSISYVWFDKYDSITGVQPKYSGKFGMGIRCHVDTKKDTIHLNGDTVYSSDIITIITFIHYS